MRSADLRSVRKAFATVYSSGALWIRMDQDIKGVEEGDHDDVGTDPFLPMV